MARLNQNTIDINRLGEKYNKKGIWFRPCPFFLCTTRHADAYRHLTGKVEENMVITVESGIYIPTGSKCDKWWNIDMRIEDDVVIGKR